MNKIENYIINPMTMALLPMDSALGELWTVVIETSQVLIVMRKPTEIIDNTCHWFGTSYAGGKSSAAAVMGYKSMLPISISSELGICVFPLASSKRRDTLWLSHTHIKDWHQKDKETTTVRFVNYQVIDLPIAKPAFELKAFRTAQLRYRLRETVEEYKLRREPVNLQQIVDLNQMIWKLESGTYKVQEMDDIA